MTSNSSLVLPIAVYCGANAGKSPAFTYAAICAYSLLDLGYGLTKGDNFQLLLVL